jgi:hypothetical protein
MAETTALTVAANLFASPSQAFAALKERPSVWLPLLALIIGYSAVSLVYMNSVDLGWYFDQQLQNADMPEAAREQAVRASTSISPMALGAIGAVTSSIAILLALFVVSLYYTGVSFATNDGIKLRQWFSFVCWCTLPVMLGIIATIVNILAGDARFMAQEKINPLALGNLLAIDTADATVLQRVLLGIDLSTLWSIVLAVLGYQMWTQRSMTKSAAIVLGPLICIVAIGVLLTLD